MGYTITTVLVLIFVIAWVHFRMAIGESGRYKKMNAFIDMEREANTTRRRDIDEAHFFRPDLSRLPIVDFDEIQVEKNAKLAQIQARVLSVAKSEMIKLELPLSNLEIKQRYGAANLETVTMCEERFDQFVRALLTWAEALQAADKRKDALLVLDYLAELNTGYDKQIACLMEANK